MKIIVGLGNPGMEYVGTRHNVGFIILDSYFNGEKWHTKDNYEFLEKNINNEKVIFIKPLTFMNLSGLAVQKVANFYKIPTEDILIIHDDLDLPEKTICSFANANGLTKNNGKIKYVCYDKTRNLWLVSMRIDGKIKNFGRFNNVDEAAKVAMEKAKEYGKV